MGPPVEEHGPYAYQVSVCLIFVSSSKETVTKNLRTRRLTSLLIIFATV